MKKVFYLPILIVFVSLTFTFASVGAVTLPWSTTYDCGVEMTQADWSGLCDGLIGGGGWTTSNGSEEQITTAANYPGGGGGKGQRHWEGDGTNNNSGGLRIGLNTEPELWVRWYMRYEAGFQWTYLSYDKLLYIKTPAFKATGEAAIVIWYGGDKFSLFSQSGGGQYSSTDGHGWDTVMQGGGGAPYQTINSRGNPETHYASDGSWHAFEIHIKMDTNGSDGISEGWIDGNQVYSHTNADLGTQAGWVSIHIGENQAFPNNGSNAMYADFDDIVISNTGYIGPIAGGGGGGGGDTTPPVISGGSPTGTLASGTTQTTLSVTTDENATCGYSTSSGTPYASMTQFSITGNVTGHSETITGLSDGSTYNYYVRCEDSLFNANTNDYSITFDVSSGGGDTTPPVISAGSPTGTLASGTKQTTLSVTTDENATCGYSTSSGTPYASMTPFTTTGGVTGHSGTISGLSDGSTYNYYVRCEDSIPNTNTNDYSITFNVSSGGGSQQAMTFYPTSADGYVGSSGASFTSARNTAVGGAVNYTSVNSRVEVTSSNEINRAFFSFDTSSLPDDAVITDATLNLHVYQKNNNDNDGDDWINVVQGNQNSPTALIADDFDQAGAINNPVEGATRVDITNITTGQYTAWILDATGLSWISKTGHTMLALREGHDVIDSTPVSFNRIKFYASEQTGTSQDPYLSITYTSGNTAPAAPTGLRIVP